MKQALLLLLIVFAAAANVVAEAQNSFPRPPELEPDIRFWTRVYSEVETDGGLIHDARHLGVVYEVIRFRESSSRRARRQLIKQAKRRYRHVLNKLARGQRQNLSVEEQRVLALWPTDVDNNTLRSAARRLRFQLGQAEKFRAGLIRSGAWAKHIENTLDELDLPAEIIALPHVESSYNPRAYSRVGAAGIWQFTRSTGRRYLRIDSAVDERMDPFKATIAAARLLKHNRAVTGSWPLAMTAYNHGAAGMRRATRKLGTTDIVTVVKRYRSRTFGFASRNFYVAFLAAIDVHYNAEKYFGTLEHDQPAPSETVEVPAYLAVRTLSRVLGIDGQTLRANNLSLRPTVWNGNKYVPRGYQLRIPNNAVLTTAQAALAAIAPKHRHDKQKRDRFYKVRRGDTLGTIAARFNVGVKDLMVANNLRSQHRIRSGQVLRLPGLDRESKITLASARPVAEVRLSTPVDGLHTVRSGDTLSLIAGRYGIDQKQLIQLNQLNNKHRIYPGQVLRLTEDAVASVQPVASPVGESVAKVEVVPETQTTPESEATVAQETGTFLVKQTPAALVADPSDYTVANGTIEVQAAETLGHFAEWLDLRASQLRRINDMRYRQPVVIGQRLQLDFSNVKVADFEQRRLAYHRGLQDQFFAQFRIAGTQAHTVRRGDSLWILSQRTYNVPIWLLRQYNPDLNFNTVLPGAKITIPLVQDRPAPAPPPRVDPVQWYAG